MLNASATSAYTSMTEGATGGFVLDNLGSFICLQFDKSHLISKMECLKSFDILFADYVSVFYNVVLIYLPSQAPPPTYMVPLPRSLRIKRDTSGRRRQM